MGGVIHTAKKGEGFPNWILLSRALSNHDAITAYTLLAERYSPPIAGRALIELIKTVPDWPKAEDWEDVLYDQKLTHRELQVLRCAELGMSNEQTGKELFLGIETVKTYRTYILIKLEAKSIGEAIHLAHNQGLIE